MLVGSEFGGTWEDPGGGFISFAIQRALKQDQTLHMEEKLQFILYFSTECKVSKSIAYANFSTPNKLSLCTTIMYVVGSTLNDDMISCKVIPIAFLINSKSHFSVGTIKC